MWATWLHGQFIKIIQLLILAELIDSSEGQWHVTGRRPVTWI